ALGDLQRAVPQAPALPVALTQPGGDQRGAHPLASALAPHLHPTKTLRTLRVSAGTPQLGPPTSHGVAARSLGGPAMLTRCRLAVLTRPPPARGPATRSPPRRGRPGHPDRRRTRCAATGPGRGGALRGCPAAARRRSPGRTCPDPAGPPPAR